MAAANTDLFKKLVKRWVGSIGAGGVADEAVTTIPLSSTTDLPTDTAVVAVIDRVDANGTATPSLEETVIGVVSGDNLINCVRGAEGTAQAHSAGAVVEILVTAKGWNDMVDGFLAEHSQLGAHTTDTISEKTSAVGVTIDGVKHKDSGVEAKSVVITTPDADNKVSLTVNQNDVTNNPNAVNIVNTGDGIALRIDNDGDGYSLIIDSNKSVGIGTGATTPWTKFCVDFGQVNSAFGFRSIANNSAAKSILTGKSDGSIIIGSTSNKIYFYWSDASNVYMYSLTGSAI
jgi:hypothetical protein